MIWYNDTDTDTLFLIIVIVIWQNSNIIDKTLHFFICKFDQAERRLAQVMFCPHGNIQTEQTFQLRARFGEEERISIIIMIPHLKQKHPKPEKGKADEDVQVPFFHLFFSPKFFCISRPQSATGKHGRFCARFATRFRWSFLGWHALWKWFGGQPSLQESTKNSPTTSTTYCHTVIHTHTDTIPIIPSGAVLAWGYWILFTDAGYHSCNKEVWERRQSSLV